MSKKILVITFEMPPLQGGGISRVSHDKICCFLQNGYQVILVAPKAELDCPGSETCEYHEISSRNNVKKTIQSMVLSVRILKKYPIDFIYGFSGTYVGLVAWTVSLFYKTRYFVMAHGAEFLKYKDNVIVRSILRLIYNGATKVIAVSDFTKKKLEEIGVRPDNITVAHNGIRVERFRVASTEDIDRIRRRHSIAKNKFVLLTISRLSRRKSHLAVLKALAKICAINPAFKKDFLYLIGGKGPEESAILEAIEEQNLGENVILLGFIPDEELTAYYSLADLFVMPSVSIEGEKNVEGFGIVFLEAGACGTPSIAGIDGGMPDAVYDGLTGYTVDGHSIDDISEKILFLYKDRGKLEEMSKNAKRIVTSEFSIEYLVKKELHDIVRFHSSCG